MMKASGHTDISTEQLLPRGGSLYKLVTTASLRAQELGGGATPLVAEVSDKPAVTALLEILHGKVTARVKDTQGKTA
jgi:DNA-directed RNA polymerase omega subunit